MRARIVLASTRGGEDGLPVSTRTVADRVGVGPGDVAKWHRRFLAERLDGLADTPPASGVRTATGKHAAGLTEHGPTRAMAERTGRSRSTGIRSTPVSGPAPHRLDKGYDVVGLYLAPPERALVVCVKRSPSQPLDRARPVLPAAPHRLGHHQDRAGGTGLLAALDATTGEVIGSLHRRHRAVEFRRFLARVDKELPATLQALLICDDNAIQRAPTVRNWLRARPRFQLYRPPGGLSWPALVERWFAESAGRRRPADPESLTALERDIRSWIAGWSTEPQPYVWVETAARIAESVTDH